MSQASSMGYRQTSRQDLYEEQISVEIQSDEQVRLEMADEVDGEDESDFEQSMTSLRDQLFYLPKKHRKRRWFQDPDFIKLCIMLGMVITYFVSELVVGIVGNSLALLADAFHMLSDAISLFIGASAVLLSKKRGTKRFSYGFGRAETLGGLINSVFLLSAVMFIGLEAIERFGEPSFIENPWLVLGVGTGGLLINLIGMLMFCGHAHGGHGHSHGGGHGHSHDSSTKEEGHGDRNDQHSHSHSHGKKKQSRSHNMLGVFLHVFGDFLGSIGVLIAAILTLIFVYGQDEATQRKHAWVMYVDPTLSVVLAILILITAVPLVIATSKILLQSVPDAVNLERLKNDLLSLNGVVSVHELHAWSVSHGKKLIGSVHLTLSDQFEMCEWETLALEAKDIFHRYGIHSTTIQPEKVVDEILKRDDVKISGEFCNQMCRSAECQENRCCPPPKVTMPESLEKEIRQRNIRFRSKPRNNRPHDEITLEDLDQPPSRSRQSQSSDRSEGTSKDLSEWSTHSRAHSQSSNRLDAAGKEAQFINQAEASSNRSLSRSSSQTNQ